nr:MAG TPA: hypothetical protein [Caudoviricetes sp.]DAG20259.1 MAG TPA: hypothetical protein [Caudoviricetes sp.]
MLFEAPIQWICLLTYPRHPGKTGPRRAESRYQARRRI